MKTGLIVIDHGSVREAANRMLEEVAEITKSRGVYDIVEPAHMDLARPTLEEAFARCVAQGAERVVVHPYFLSPGRHSQKDIPRMTAEAAARYPGLAAVVSEPLGIDGRLIDVVLDRAREVSTPETVRRETSTV